jgi:hypothetical protein
MSDKRSIPQNGSLHQGLRSLGDKFNDAGLDMRKVLKPAFDIPWTESSVKKFMFNPIAMVMYEKTSSELSTVEIQEVWKVLIRHTGEKHGVTVDWPNHHNGGKC